MYITLGPSHETKLEQNGRRWSRHTREPKSRSLATKEPQRQTSPHRGDDQILLNPAEYGIAPSWTDLQEIMFGSQPNANLLCFWPFGPSQALTIAGRRPPARAVRSGAIWPVSADMALSYNGLFVAIGHTINHSAVPRQRLNME